VQFRREHRYRAEPEAVARAYASEALYAGLGAGSKLAPPEVLDRRDEGGGVVLRIRYRFIGELSSAVRAVLDPARLTWVDESTHDLAARTVAFRLVADHYADRFSCAGTYRFVADGTGTVRHTEAELKVRAPLVGGKVERVLADDLSSHLAAEVHGVEAFLAR
jgi:hypothetical protein